MSVPTTPRQVHYSVLSQLDSTASKILLVVSLLRKRSDLVQFDVSRIKDILVDGKTNEIEDIVKILDHSSNISQVAVRLNAFFSGLYRLFFITEFENKKKIFFFKFFEINQSFFFFLNF